mmetsp:Transcript_3596/g.9052  ORF Transcript_3596/g.9052 Transcript_3596/m.9052 type:complete len:106 (+) Transcript_3596:1071-1388(+)
MGKRFVSTMAAACACSMNLCGDLLPASPAAPAQGLGLPRLRAEEGLEISMEVVAREDVRERAVRPPPVAVDAVAGLSMEAIYSSFLLAVMVMADRGRWAGWFFTT